MNITNSDFQKISKALYLTHGKIFNSLDEDSKQAIVDAEVVMVNLIKKQKANNKRTASYIAEKRKNDKLYARENSYKEKKGR